MRLDRWIRDRYPGLTQAQAREIFDRGWVRDATGAALAKGQGLPKSKAPTLDAWEARLRELRRGDPTIELPVLAEAADYWVVDKPPGFPGHPVGIDDVRTATQWAFAKDPHAKEAFPEPVAMLTPHRLDLGTSGCLVVARTREGYDRWREKFSTHANVKTYLAWTWGTAGANACVIRHSIGPEPGDPRRRRAVGEQIRAEGVYPAETTVEPVHQTRTLTLWRARCRTGVTHQIRVHFASIGFPLVGDRLYDPEFAKRSLRPEHHWLRASMLDGPLGRFEAPTEAFVRLGDEADAR